MTAKKKVTVTGPLDQRRNIIGYPRFNSIIYDQVTSEYFGYLRRSQNCINILTLFGETSNKNENIFWLVDFLARDHKKYEIY